MNFDYPNLVIVWKAEIAAWHEPYGKPVLEDEMPEQSRSDKESNNREINS